MRINILITKLNLNHGTASGKTCDLGKVMVCPIGGIC